MKRVPVRRRVRAITTTLFLVIFPAIFYYLSPYIPVTGSVEGVVTGSLIVFACLFVVSMFLGRAFCSYVCPGGTVGDHLSEARRARFPRRSLGWLKFMVWAVWLAALVFFFRRAGGVRAVHFGYRTELGLSVSDVSSLLAYLTVVGIFAVMSLAFGRRAACHTICWMAPFMILGRRLGRAVKLPSLRINATPDTCTRCSLCDAACPMSLPVSRLQAKGEISSGDCILCGKCVDVCRSKTLIFGWR